VHRVTSHDFDKKSQGLHCFVSNAIYYSLMNSIFNFVQETALNHVWMSGLLSDGFGATHGMMRNDLIWVVSRMQVLIDYYPIW
jgi:hypothetical protein